MFLLFIRQRPYRCSWWSRVIEGTAFAPFISSNQPNHFTLRVKTFLHLAVPEPENLNPPDRRKLFGAAAPEATEKFVIPSMSLK